MQKNLYKNLFLTLNIIPFSESLQVMLLGSENGYRQQLIAFFTKANSSQICNSIVLPVISASINFRTRKSLSTCHKIHG